MHIASPGHRRNENQKVLATLFTIEKRQICILEDGQHYHRHFGVHTNFHNRTLLETLKLMNVQFCFYN